MIGRMLRPFPTARLFQGIAGLIAAAATAALLLGGASAAPGDDVADRVFGQNGSFTSDTCNLGGLGAGSLCRPFGAAVDGAGNLYVADLDNNRVLEYDTPLTTDAVADRVFGQGGSFTSGTCNNGGRSAGSLCGPTGVTVDAAGNLYVAENGNSRVLEYDSPLTTDTVADRVFGQGGDFTSGACDVGPGGLCAPWRVALDASGNLYVADTSNQRVLEYDTPLTSDTLADGVFGQGGSFTTRTCNSGGLSAGSFCDPIGVALDASGNLYVADTSNRRVLEFDTPLTTDTVGDRVFGQGGSFTSNTCNLGGVSASSLCQPHGVALDVAGNLYVGDTSNHRVLEYNTPLTTDAVADRVFGQGGSFASPTCNLGGISASSLCNPFDVALDGGGNLYVGDVNNNRVLEYDVPLGDQGVHDAKLKKISASSSVVLSDGTPDIKNLVVQVRNEGDHTESFGVYLDIVAPGGSSESNPNGCTPHGRIINTVVTLAPDEQAVVETAQTFSCANVAGALGQTYTIMAVADAHAEDAGACGAFQIQSMTCFNALADDDNDAANSRTTTNGFKVK